MICTTSNGANKDDIAYAKRLAAEFDWPYVARERQAIRQLQADYDTEALLVVTKRELHYYEADRPAFFFHPSLALVRLKRLLSGDVDPLITSAGVTSGDVVLDCTAGMAADAIVLAHAVGPAGKVIALESETIPYLLVREGLRHYTSPLEPLNEAMRRIDMVHINHLLYLQQLPDRSVDVVYFDPMFRQPLKQSSALNPLRSLANKQRLTEEAIEEAKRVARRAVVLKEQRRSEEFARLGLTIATSDRAKIAYGVIEIAQQ